MLKFCCRTLTKLQALSNLHRLALAPANLARLDTSLSSQVGAWSKRCNTYALVETKQIAW